MLRPWPVVALLALAFVAACSPDAPVVPSTPAASTPGSAGTPAAAASPVAKATSAVVGTPTAAAAASTPGCVSGQALTPEQAEGPFYSSNPPLRANLLEPGFTGTRLVVSGAVLTRDCRPVPNARVDFWQTDDKGVYDNTGFRYRGYQVADADGRYRLETAMPAEYPGRTAHIHVKITPPGGATLTTQLYFPDVARNASDGIFRRELLVRDLVRGPEGVTARFDFIVATR
jgi:protocatechuate 3,4-dioxygenase beta subunit